MAFPSLSLSTSIRSLFFLLPLARSLAPTSPSTSFSPPSLILTTSSTYSTAHLNRPPRTTFQMGFPLERFVEQPPAWSRCSVCEKVLKEPLWVCSKEHAECARCYSGSCIKCGGGERAQVIAEHRATPAPFLARLIGELSIVCENKPSGCPWTGKLSAKSTEHKKCQYSTTFCPNNCGQLMRLKNVQSHRRSTCPLQKIACRRGIIDGLYKCQYLRKDAEGHVDKCHYYECSVDGCSTRGSRDMLQQHEEECLEVHKELSTAQSSLNRLKNEREFEQSWHEEIVEDLKDNIAYYEEEIDGYETYLEEARGETYTIAKRLLALETHLGLQPSVKVDDESAEADVILRELSPEPAPAPANPGDAAALAQPPRAEGENWIQDGVDLRPIPNPTPTQAKLHRRLFKSFEAKVAEDEAKEKARKAAESSEDDLMVLVIVPAKIQPALPPQVKAKPVPSPVRVRPKAEEDIEALYRDALGSSWEGPYTKKFLDIKRRLGDSFGDGAGEEAGPAPKKQKES